MARRLTALKPLTLSSEKTAHDGLSCSPALTMPTAISAPPTTLTPSCMGVLHGWSRAKPAFSSSSAGTRVVVNTLPISSPSSAISTRPASRRSAAPMPIGLVPPSGLRSPTSSDSPSTSATAGSSWPALMRQHGTSVHPATVRPPPPHAPFQAIHGATFHGVPGFAFEPDASGHGGCFRFEPP